MTIATHDLALAGPLERAVRLPVLYLPEVPKRRRDFTGLWLLLMTIAGGWFRFYHLGFPTLWSDEALVFWRACGTYRQLLGPLSTDGFPPLHYSLYWLIGHYTKLTPVVMRLVPAVTGTLSIPATYFFARQLLQKKTSLLAAAFTACSAFMLFYSRDAKMYPATWLMVTLNLGCLLWWFRTGRSTAWLGWVAAGALMLGLHLSAAAILAVAPVMFLTQRRVQWTSALAFLLGLSLILAGPVGYLTKFNHWTENVEERGWGASGIGWVGWFNGDRTGPEHARYAASAFLAGWEWPRDDYLPKIDPPLYDGPRLVTLELLAILAIAALPWPKRWRPAARVDPPPQPQWRVAFWIGLVTVVPAYGYYCQSVRGFFSPLRMAFEFGQTLSTRQWEAIAFATGGTIVGSLAFPSGRQMLIRLSQWIAMAVALLGLCQAIFYVCFTISANADFDLKPLGTVWTPRYLGVIWPGLCLAVACLLMRLPTRALRTAAIIFVLGINIAMASLRLALWTEPPLDKLADDISASQPQTSPTKVFIHFYSWDLAVGGGSLFTDAGKYYLQNRNELRPMSPGLFKASLGRYRIETVDSAASAAAQVRRDAGLTRVITWVQEPPQVVDRTDVLSPLLPGWTLAHEQWFPVHVIWDWRLRWNYVRRVYRKNSVAAPAVTKH